MLFQIIDVRFRGLEARLNLVAALVACLPPSPGLLVISILIRARETSLGAFFLQLLATVYLWLGWT